MTSDRDDLIQGSVVLPALKHVAARAGVSPSTASRVFRKQGYVSDAARARVLAAASELGYEPHSAASALKSRTSRAIGLVIQDITNPFYASVAKGTADTVRETDYVLLVSDTEEDRGREAKSLRAMLRARVAGVIAVPTVGNVDIYRLLLRYGIGIVQVDRTLGGITTDSVLVDNFAGAYAGTRHLLDLGHRELGIVAGPRSLTTGHQRLLGVEAAMRDVGVSIRPGLIKISDFRRESAVVLARELLDHRPRPTAIFAHNNVLAEMMLVVLRERGLQIPGDVALLGFDDVPWAIVSSPQLSVVRQPAYTIGTTAANLLLGRLTDASANPFPTEVVLSPTLVVRGSCGGRAA